jgi:hypothetical protein
VIPQNVDSSQGFYALGTVVLVLGIIAAVAGTLIRRRLEEEHRDVRYVRERRGEEVGPVETPRIAGVLLRVGVAVGSVGIVLLVIGWTLAPGQT